MRKELEKQFCDFVAPSVDDILARSIQEKENLGENVVQKIVFSDEKRHAFSPSPRQKKRRKVIQDECIEIIEID